MQNSNWNPRRLSRVEQLTLNTWRWAFQKLGRTLEPSMIVEHAALHAVLASLRDLDEPTLLIRRHAEAYPEFRLITSLIAVERDQSIAYDILDSAFLLRWNELVAGGDGPREIPPLRARSEPGPIR